MKAESVFAEKQRGMLLEAVNGIGVDAYDLWLSSLGLGGQRDPFEIDAYLHGLMPLPARDRVILIQCVWEMYRDLYPPGENPFNPSSHPLSDSSSD